VTNAQYRQCVEAGDCSPPLKDRYFNLETHGDHPVVGVTWQQAAQYCTWAGARLPTEAEWEYAARGPEGLRYPWGDEFDGERLNYCDTNCLDLIDWRDETTDDGYSHTAPVGSYPDGISWCGAYDLAGNTAEWGADWYGLYPDGRQVDPQGPSSGEQRVVRGGSWHSDPSLTRGAFRLSFSEDYAVDYVGFRCAQTDR
jgi:formylglycine-generating enzyme required for sulfatase activity